MLRNLLNHRGRASSSTTAVRCATGSTTDGRKLRDQRPGRRDQLGALAAGGSPLAGYSKSMVKPNLFVDGRQYIVYWGQVTLEVPADRHVHLGVGMQDGIRGASLLLPPGAEPVLLDYHVPATGEVSFGPRAPAPPTGG